MTVTEQDTKFSALTARIDKLVYDRERYRDEARRLRRAVEKKDLRIAAMRGDQRVLTQRLAMYEKRIAHLENALAAWHRLDRRGAA